MRTPCRASCALPETRSSGSYSRALALVPPRVLRHLASPLRATLGVPRREPVAMHWAAHHAAVLVVLAAVAARRFLRLVVHRAPRNHRTSLGHCGGPRNHWVSHPRRPALTHPSRRNCMRSPPCLSRYLRAASTEANVKPASLRVEDPEDPCRLLCAPPLWERATHPRTAPLTAHGPAPVHAPLAFLLASRLLTKRRVQRRCDALGLAQAIDRHAAVPRASRAAPAHGKIFALEVDHTRPSADRPHAKPCHSSPR